MGTKTIVAAVCVLFEITAQGTAARAQEMISSNTTKIEEKLAVINADRLVRTDDVTVSRFRFLLSELSSAAAESPTVIGDQLTMTRRIIREKYGKDVGLLALAEMAFRSKSQIKAGDSTAFFARLAIFQGSS